MVNCLTLMLRQLTKNGNWRDLCRDVPDGNMMNKITTAMKTIPYSINEANGNQLLSLAWNGDHTGEEEQLTETGGVEQQTNDETGTEED